MSRYGWSSGRDQSSPYTPTPGGIPAVTDDDFSYITSQDLDDPSYLGTTEGHGSQRSHSVTPAGPEDDVLIIKNKGVTYPMHFPAYTIGDGKLRVKDVRDRVGWTMELPDRATSRIKLLYKGRQLKDLASPVRDYGVKNKSELMAVMPDIIDDSSASEEEMVIIDEDREDSKPHKRRKNKGRKGGRKQDTKSEASDSATNSNAFDPSLPSVKEKVIPAPIKKLNELNDQYNEKWLPLCKEFIASPPSDAKKREDEHRKISESIMGQILLKLDGVESEGVDEVRTRRRALVKEVQEMLKQLDAVKKG